MLVCFIHAVSVQNSLFGTLEAKLGGLQGLESEDKQSVEGVQRALVSRYLTESQQSGTPAEDVKEKLCELRQKKYLIAESVYQWSLKKVMEIFMKDEDLSLNSAEDVKEKLCELRQKKYLITESVYQWSLKMVKEIFTQDENLPLNSAELTSPADPQHTESLFSKDTIYHASICCQALTCCTAGDYQKFFKEKVPGHSFQAVSISRPTPDGKQHERYLIAKQGESKYYIAFESQPVLSQWPKKYHSFIEG